METYLRKPNTFVNYRSLVTKPQREFDYPNHFLIFENASAIVECFNRNFKDFKQLRFDGDGWTFGYDFVNFTETSKHLINGSCPDSVLSQVEEAKFSLYQKYPFLWELEKTARTKKRVRRFSEAGGELDIDRLMSGQPEYWQTINKENKKQSVKILINTAISAGSDSVDIVNNMILLAAFVEILNLAGISSEIMYSKCTKHPTSLTKYTACMFTLKGADEKLDIARILSASAPGLVRHFIFTINYNLMKGNGDIGCGRPIHSSNIDFVDEVYKADIKLSTSQPLDTNIIIMTDKLKEILL